jgi:hypothetical protein
MRFTITAIFAMLCQLLSAQGFLKTNGPSVVNAQGEKIILRGVGLGGWMLQEGYMLRVNGIGQQQHVIRKNIEELIGKEKTNEFYNAWLTNHTRTKLTSTRWLRGDSTRCDCRCIIIFIRCPWNKNLLPEKIRGWRKDLK